jgi:hypothetical protein
MRRTSEWLAVGLAIVVAIRAVRFVGNPGAAGARGERDYFAWAWRSPAFLDRLAEARPGLVPGELISITLPAGPLEPWWVRFVADYALPAQGLVAVDSGGSRRVSPHLTQLIFDASGRLAIRRPQRVGRP